MGWGVATARAALSPLVSHALTVAKVLHGDHGDSRLIGLCKELAISGIHRWSLRGRRTSRTVISR
jgi:hypothetical protein